MELAQRREISSTLVVQIPIYEIMKAARIPGKLSIAVAQAFDASDETLTRRLTFEKTGRYGDALFDQGDTLMRLERDIYRLRLIGGLRFVKVGAANMKSGRFSDKRAKVRGFFQP